MPGSIKSIRIEHRDPGDGGSLKAPGLVEHFFRHDYGRLVAILARRIGVRHIELVEDAVQSALMAALNAWTERGLPEDPGAWLYRVAYNQLIQDLRRESGRLRILEKLAHDLSNAGPSAEDPVSPDEIRDDLLRMLFVCCDEAIALESRLVLALKTLCGFSTAEIALRLFTTEANVHKRLGRARDRLRQTPLNVETPPLETLRSRLPSVHGVLYLLFNEGYLSAHDDQPIRRELCDEALRLATHVAEHPVGAVPESFALLALMHFHAARLGSRIDPMGGLLLLDEQDRSLWDRRHISLGAEWLRRSAGGDAFSRFHAEAGIAAEHCFAPSFQETRWDEIVELYALLERVDPSPLHTLNKAVAVAEWRGPEAGLAIVEGLAPPAWLSGSYLWDAVLADLHLRAQHFDIARQHRDRALESAPTNAVRELLRRRLSALGASEMGNENGSGR
jgi:RNA polymerase sigma-70 factor (ECF subfamily)